ncbi:hypothetical protein [Ruegeria sp. HKCCD8929]|uniref:hypothetical protein n=1 Tax=Ruegeria sp. HKCCD8929 TaxID=2683006 RepID=UPI0014899F1F|nr:hypothetical protein [Ruegeria sp. HKCCD8929]
MGLIVKSFTLSFGVFGRMILPILAIMVVSSILWGLLNLVSGGYLSFLSGPITATFIGLFGIRTALALMGDNRRTEYEILILYSVLYGVFLLIAKGGALLLSDIAAVAYADWRLGDAVSFRNFLNAEKSLQLAFGFYALSAKAVVSLVMYTSVCVVMAVPLASAARAAGRGTTSAGFFAGAGRSFIPLFCIFAVSFFLQFFFELFTSLFAMIPLLLSVISVVFSQTIPDFDLDALLKGAAASAGLLWLHSWIWAASAVALVKADQSSEQQLTAAPAQAATTIDMRALRKSRE